VDDLHGRKSGKTIRIAKLPVLTRFWHEQTVTDSRTPKKLFSSCKYRLKRTSVA
jgi:hypothetical protein